MILKPPLPASPRRLALMALVGLGLSLACRRPPPPAPPASAAGLAPIVIRFSDQGNAGIFAYAKREHLLEPELAKVNARIEWVPAAGAFSASFDAMNSGALNASGGAISPIVGALSHNLPFRIYAIANPGGARRAGILVPGTSAIQSVRELVGKRVAVNLAAHGDYLLLKALADAKVPASAVERVPIQPPDAAAAFATGKIDAWSTFGTFFSTAVRNGARILALERELGSDDVSVLAAHVSALEKNPAAFQVLLRVARELGELAQLHPERFQNVFSDKGPRATSGEELRIAIDETRTTPPFHVPTADDRRRVQNVAGLFFKHKSIDRDIAVDEVVFDVDEAAPGRGPWPRGSARRRRHDGARRRPLGATGAARAVVGPAGAGDTAVPRQPAAAARPHARAPGRGADPFALRLVARIGHGADPGRGARLARRRLPGPARARAERRAEDVPARVARPRGAGRDPRRGERARPRGRSRASRRWARS